MKEKLSHLTNLVSLIYEDGKLDKKELDLLYRIAERYDIDENEIITMLNQQIDYDFIVPANEEDKLNQLHDLASMMMVDGSINPGEKGILYKIAEKFSLSEEIVNKILAVLK